MDKVLSLYESYIRGELGLSEATLSTYLYQVRKFLVFLSGRNTSYTDFSVDDFEAFLA